MTREFYINDRGNQMDLFGASIEARAFGEPVPEDGYQGEYVVELARRVLADAAPSCATCRPAPERTVAFREAGYALQLREQQESLARFHTDFDVWFSERSLHDSDDVAAGLEKLRAQGHLYDADGALWMRTTDFGDDRDRVLIRTNGELDLLRQRHRLLRQQARARLRPLPLPARRRPPRLRRSAQGDGGLRRRRPRPQPSRS